MLQKQHRQDTRLKMLIKQQLRTPKLRILPHLHSHTITNHSDHNVGTQDLSCESKMIPAIFFYFFWGGHTCINSSRASSTDEVGGLPKKAAAAFLSSQDNMYTCKINLIFSNTIWQNEATPSFSEHTHMRAHTHTHTDTHTHVDILHSCPFPVNSIHTQITVPQCNKY